MEQQKHTPGPWKAEWHRKYKQWNVFPESGKAVVSVTDLCGEYSKEETEANARLIAAAPDLLEALMTEQKALELAHTNYGEVGGAKTHWGIFEAADTQARAAIAKATGGAS